MKLERIIGALTAVASAIDETGHQWIEVMPVCAKSQNGPHRFEVTAADLEVFAADIRARGDKISIDYDHSYIGSGNTLAAGWFTDEARVEGDKLLARVRWTPQAQEQIKSGQYRFISPEWSMEAKGADGYWRKAKEFLAATLTNRPFFQELAAVGKDDPGGEPATNEGDNMRDALIASLGLPKDATDEQITAKLAEVKANADKAEELETEVTTLKAAAEATPTDEEERKKLLEDAKAGVDAKEELRVMKRDTLISSAIAARKIDPAEKEKYVSLYDAAPDATTELIASLKEGKLGAIGSEHDAPGEGGSQPLAASAGSNGDALTGTHIPKSVMIAGTEHDVDEESAKIHVAALALLDEAGKRLTFTEDEYTAAAIVAADKQGIRL
jgi:phage I-like protein